MGIGLRRFNDLWTGDVNACRPCLQCNNPNFARRFRSFHEIADQAILGVLCLRIFSNGSSTVRLSLFEILEQTLFVIRDSPVVIQEPPERRKAPFLPFIAEIYL